MDVKVSVKENELTWEVTKLEKAEGCADIATIDVPGLNLLTVDAVETGANSQEQRLRQQQHLPEMYLLILKMDLYHLRQTDTCMDS